MDILLNLSEQVSYNQFFNQIIYGKSRKTKENFVLILCSEK